MTKLCKKRAPSQFIGARFSRVAAAGCLVAAQILVASLLPAEDEDTSSGYSSEDNQPG